MIKRLLSYVGEYRKYAILTPLFMIGEVVMEVLIPLVMAQIIDNGIQGTGGMNYTLKMGAIMVMLAFISLFFGAAGGRAGAVAAMGFAKNLRNSLFDKVQDFSFSNIDKFSTGSLVTRLTTDVTNTQNAFMMILRVGFRAPTMLIGATIMAVRVNARLSLVFLVAIPILGGALYFIISKAHPRFLEMLKRYDTMNTVVQENLIGIRVVKAFVREDHEDKKFRDHADSVRKAQFFAEKLVIMNVPVMQLCMYGSILAVLWFGGNMVLNRSFEIGELSSFLSYIAQILMSLMMLSMIFIISIISYASVQRIMEVLDETPNIQDAAGETELHLEDGSIEFRDVSFSYANDPENLTLSHINLSIASGQTIGIIGGTGSAKTSLVQLIPRLYDVLDGQLIVGGHDVRDYKLRDLREEVAMVLQKNVLFSGTIRDNLKWGDENATDEEIQAACESAQAHDFVQSFPDGYNTDLGQGGVNVSGGQKQRLCIARALLKKPKIIILDDSTSAVDTATDSKIRAAFRKKLKGTTTLIIAQRISSVCDADKIIVLDEGKINGFGTHEELMKTNEIYREVYESQQKGVDEYARTNA
ncbi:ABC transporter ATP-binding protein [Caproiciproducens sp. LBM24188]|nr:ABC transporter ATP-binding protein [Oscillospiraceae bacterium]HHV31443.1 ABC transporter ATP-binding protein [Clostridiales bacterium]